ncbi:MAG: hypothetical protein GW763_12290 [Paraglaciecola sp.]|nr:hypothetical protein [Paraglaciecola sp.]NCT48743.1 hypothetical protein [Paraglaciecola sp.]
MISNIQLSQKSQDILNIRKLSPEEVDQFTDLLTEAKNQQGSSKSKLQSLTVDELRVIQKAHGLADPININSLTEEGAANLFGQVDHSDKVDLNNDGIVEVGVGKLVIFPPVNAPEHVKLAWQKAIEGMPEGDLMTLELGMHHAMFGIRIEGYDQKPVLDPAEQWSQTGIEQFFQELRAGLEFNVNLQGWTHTNLMLKDFYDRFETALQKGPKSANTPDSSSQFIASQGNEQSKTEKENVSAELIQLVLDARVGIDRRKLEQIEERIQAISADKNLSDSQRHDKIAALEKFRDTLIEEAQQRSVQHEKRKALLSKNDNLVEHLHEQKLIQS